MRRRSGNTDKAAKYNYLRTYIIYFKKKCKISSNSIPLSEQSLNKKIFLKCCDNKIELTITFQLRNFQWCSWPAPLVISHHTVLNYY